MATVRYIVDDVDAALAFYCERLGFTEVMHPAPAFAMVARDDLRLALSRPGGGPGGGAAMPDGTAPTPGGWNRFSLQVDDLDAVVDALRGAGVRFRNEIVEGVGGRQILVEDPSGNPVELFEPTRDEARLGGSAPAGETFEVRPIGWVESELTDRAQAPSQGMHGAPAAWLRLEPEIREGARDIATGDDILVLTWLHQAPRDELTTRPRNDPNAAERGVFSTRSPARPNPIGLHRVTVLKVAEGRLYVEPLEAIDGTPVVDLKPVIA